MLGEEMKIKNNILNIPILAWYFGDFNTRETLHRYFNDDVDISFDLDP